LQGCGQLQSKTRAVKQENPALPLTTKESNELRRRVYRPESPKLTATTDVTDDVTSHDVIAHDVTEAGDSDSGEFLSASAIFPSIDSSPRSDATDLTHPGLPADPTPDAVNSSSDHPKPCNKSRSSDAPGSAFAERVRLEPRQGKADYVRYTRTGHYPLNH